MPEKDIVKAILSYLKTVPECFYRKEHGGMYGTAGIPDIICCHRSHFYAFEVKTGKGKPTELQRPPYGGSLKLSRWNSRGFTLG